MKTSVSALPRAGSAGPAPPPPRRPLGGNRQETDAARPASSVATHGPFESPRKTREALDLVKVVSCRPQGMTVALRKDVARVSGNDTGVQQIRPLLFRRAPIARNHFVTFHSWAFGVVTCSFRALQIYGVRKAHLSLTDESCVASSNATHFILTTSLSECNTQQLKFPDRVVFKNTVSNNTSGQAIFGTCLGLKDRSALRSTLLPSCLDWNTLVKVILVPVDHCAPSGWRRGRGRRWRRRGLRRRRRCGRHVFRRRRLPRTNGAHQGLLPVRVPHPGRGELPPAAVRNLHSFKTLDTTRKKPKSKY